MLRLDDPTDNRGLGWTRLTEPQVIDLLYIGLKLSMPSDRRGLSDRNATRPTQPPKPSRPHSRRGCAIIRFSGRRDRSAPPLAAPGTGSRSGFWHPWRRRL